MEGQPPTVRWSDDGTVAVSNANEGVLEYFESHDDFEVER